ncbi:hypothetical protein HAHE_33120 [Haloferula helveola]|uniref:ATP-binding protein n=1 Tax=Haloferula helveola TaxID=490095 RepID=A0ABN6HA13_9BACT|nr:hypothetical protein HAHE_33120 [Haloferula helveola]
MQASSFQPYFENFGQPGAPHAGSINAAAGVALDRELRAPVDAPGRGFLLRSPRAGYGKTHLLEKLRQGLSGTHEFLPLRPLDGRHVHPGAAIEDALRRLTRQLPASGGLTSLDIHARHLFAHGLQPLVVSGEVPCQDREAAAMALRKRPVETFDFHHPQAVTAHWTRENFEVLGPRLSLEISRSTGGSLNQVAFWVAALFRFAIASPEHPGRAGTLLQHAADGADAERFGTFLALISRLKRVVLVVDDLEGVHGDPGGARRVAGFLASVRQDAPRIDIVVSINDDVWESSFMPALSGGLRDRLSEVPIRLDALDDDKIVSLLASRGHGSNAREIINRLELRPEDRYSRRVLRLAEDLLKREPELNVSPAEESEAEDGDEEPAPFEKVEDSPLATVGEER